MGVVCECGCVRVRIQVMQAASRRHGTLAHHSSGGTWVEEGAEALVCDLGANLTHHKTLVWGERWSVVCGSAAYTIPSRVAGGTFMREQDVGGEAEVGNSDDVGEPKDNREERGDDTDQHASNVPANAENPEPHHNTTHVVRGCVSRSCIAQICSLSSL